MVMRPPKPKEIPGYMPSFLSYSIQLGLSSLYEGNAYADSGEECPACGSTHIRKAGFVEKQFAKFITEGFCFPYKAVFYLCT